MFARRLPNLLFSILLASAGVSHAQTCTYGEDTCKPGLVWRDAYPGDHVCVTGQTRDQAAKDNAQSTARSIWPLPTCRFGWVWRVARPTDLVCVTGQTRAQVNVDNQKAAGNRDPACAAPPGSYRQTCKDIAFVNGVLSATCKDFNQNDGARSELSTKLCIDDIANSGGYLSCDYETPPGGSYQTACEPWIWAAGKLNALCKIPDRDYRVKSELANYKNCQGDIFFDEFQDQDSGLHCTRQKFPSGPYQQSCKYIWYEGDVLHAKCKRHKSAPWPFGSDIWWGSRLLNVTACLGEIRNNNGELICATSFPAPNLLDQTLPNAVKSIKDAGLLLGTLDASCASIYEDATLIKAQSPAAGSTVRRGDKLSITKCQPGQPPNQCPDGSSPRQYDSCGSCPSNLGPYLTTYSILTCKSDADTKSYIEQYIFPPPCSVTAGVCP